MRRVISLVCLGVVLLLGGCSSEHQAETETPDAVSTDSDMMQQSIGSVVYQNRKYWHYETYADGENLIGEYVEGSSVSESEYGAYAVDGSDPSFMLCTRYQSGSVSIYICRDDLSLETGGDLFDTLLHLPDGYAETHYQSHDEWFWGSDEFTEINEDYRHIVDDFVAALCGSEPILVETLFPEGSENSIYDTETGHLYFRMNNGMTVHLRLFGGHLVGFEGTMNYCFRVDGEAFDALVELVGNSDAVTEVVPETVLQHTREATPLSACG